MIGKDIKTQDYESPLCTIMAVECGMILCQSRIDGNHDGYEPGDDLDFTIWED